MIMEELPLDRTTVPMPLPMKEKQESLKTSPAQSKSVAPANERDRADVGMGFSEKESEPAPASANVLNRQISNAYKEPRQRATLSPANAPAENDEMILQQDMETIDTIESLAPADVVDSNKLKRITPETAAGFSSSPLIAPDNKVDGLIEEITDTTSPEQWLEIIRTLYRSGKTDDADKTLKEPLIYS
jgi:hypothetical protein